jgi:recombination protein RecT
MATQQPPGPPPAGNNNGQPAKSQAQLTPFQERFVSFRKFLRTMEGQLTMALPKHVKAEHLIRVVLTEISKTPKLLDCTQESMVGALMHAAQLGLDVGGVLGQSYLVPFKNRKKGGALEVQLIPGYKGLVKLAYQSGEVGAIRARVVRARDEFHYEYGIDEVLIHKPYRGPDPGALVAVYAVARIKGLEESQFVVLEKWEVDAIRNDFSKSADNGPWVTDYEEMAKKSAVRRLCKLLPQSVENDALAKAVATDERAQAGLEPDYENAIDVNVVPAEEGEPTEAADGADGDEAGAGEQGKPQSDLDKLAADKRAKREAAAADKAPKRNQILDENGKPIATGQGQEDLIK